MKAVALTDINKFSLIEKPKPKISSSNEVLVKIEQVGICGSDIHYFTTGRIGEQIIDFPFIIGHEAMGTIEDVGNKVTTLQKGQRVAIEPSFHCGECDQCKSGRIHTCRKNQFLGCPGQLEGALQEYLILKESNCIPIHESISNDEAVISEPMSIGIYTVKRSGIISSQSSAIVGYGPIGQSVSKALKAYENIPQMVIEKLSYRSEIASKEVENTLKPSAPNYKQKLKEIGESGYDVVYECCGDQQGILDAITILKPGGKLVVVGIPEVMNISLPIHTLRRKEIDIINIRRQVGCVEESLQLMKEKKIIVDNMVSHHFQMDEVQEAFEMVSNYQDNVMKAMIKIG